MDQTLKQILSELQKINGRMDSWEAGQKEHYQLTRGLEDNVTVTRTIVSKTSEDMNYLKGTVTGLEKRLSDVERKVG